jgi:apolipoprotein N-acyltransferase
MEALLTAAAGGKPKPALVFVGATVQDSLAATAVAMGWMEQPQTVAVGQASSCWVLAESLRITDPIGLTWSLTSYSSAAS